jgi:hypothetical protein
VKRALLDLDVEAFDAARQVREIMAHSARIVARATTHTVSTPSPVNGRAVVWLTAGSFQEITRCLRPARPLGRLWRYGPRRPCQCE